MDRKNKLRFHGALFAIAAAQAAAGDVEGTKATLAGLEEDLSTPWAKPLIGFAQAKSGDTAGAVKTVSAGEKNSVAVCLGYGVIVAAQLERGDRDGAKETLGRARELIIGLDSKEKAEGALVVLRGAILGPAGAGGSFYARTE